MDNKIKNFIFIILAVSLFFISQIFLLVQGIKNYKFFKFDDEKIIVEKTLFEQFSQEVYESINTPFSRYSFTTNCNINNQIRFPLYLNTFYDCRNIHSSELKKECQDGIIANYTDCTPGSSTYNYDYNINYEDRINFDSRIKYCEYFSRFNQKISKLQDYYMCREGSSYKYEDLLYNSVKLDDLYGASSSCPTGRKICGILDTKNNWACLPDSYNCPYNVLNFEEKQTKNSVKIDDGLYLSYSNNANQNIFTSFIISENQPMNHEWDIYVREKNEELDDEDINKRRKLTKKDFELVGDKEDMTYQKLNVEISAEELLNSNRNNIQTTRLNLDQNLNIFARNYIGFKDHKELINFKKIFNEEDPMDNPLYKITSSGHNPIITITFSSVFIIIDILFLVFEIIKFKSQNNNNDSLIIIIFIIVNSVFFFVELLIIAFHFIKYPKIHIDMDERMQKVLDLYNDRTFSTQVYRIISLVFSTVSLVMSNIKFSIKENNLIHNE